MIMSLDTQVWKLYFAMMFVMVLVVMRYAYLLLSPAPLAGALSDDAHLISVCLTSVTYFGPKLRTERPRKTKIGTEIAHVTHDSDTTFKIKRSMFNLWGWGILWRPSIQLVLFIDKTFLILYNVSD